MIRTKVTVRRRGSLANHIGKIERGLQGPRAVKVGFPKGHAGADIVSIAIWNHFGTSRGIPPRPFITIAMFKNRRQIQLAMRKIAKAQVADGTPVSRALPKLGALGAGQEFVASYHVLDPPGVIGTNPTLDGRIESGTSNAFTVPTTRLNLPQAAEPMSAFLRIDGDTTPVTDTWWRPKFTAVGGTDSPSFTVLMAAAIRAK